MAWIESHEEITEHPKTKRAARTLGISLPQMVGHMHFLWFWCLKFAQDGNLSQYDTQDIADAAAWEGDSQVFVRALVECGPGSSSGFLDEDEHGGLFVHDWMDYAGRLIDKRKENAERMRIARAKHVHKKCEATVPNLTVPNQIDNDDDNARAREEIKNRALDLNREEPNNPVPAMSVEAVEDDSLQSNNALPLSKSIGSRAIAFTESEFGRPLSQTEVQGISDFCNEFSKRHSRDPDGIVIEGVRRCIENNQRKISYLRGIVIDWLDHGVTDIGHIASRDAEWSNAKNKKMKGAKRNAKNLGTPRSRIDSSDAYDPAEWARAGFAVSSS